MIQKPSEKEEEYFARMEFERKKKIEDEKNRQLREEEKKNLAAIHRGRCPKCGLELIEVDYKGIKVDKCSGCEGVWLDAGELERVSCLDQGALECFFGVFKK